ncbi:MAG: hypothetical protein RL643_244, partial [Actinomycetota bacterium]
EQRAIVDLTQHCRQQSKRSRNRHLFRRGGLVQQFCRTIGRPAHVHPDTHHHETILWRCHGQQSAQFCITHHEVVGPLQLRSHPSHRRTCGARSQRHHSRPTRRILDCAPKQQRAQQVCSAGGFPCSIESSLSRGLVIGNQHAAMGCSGACGRKEIVVGGSGFAHMANGPTDRPIRLRTRI